MSFDLLPQLISWYVKVRLLLKLRLSLLLDIYKKIFHFFVFFSCYLLISLFRKYFLRNNSFFGVFFASWTLDVFVLRRCGGGGGGVGDRLGGDEAGVGVRRGGVGDRCGGGGAGVGVGDHCGGDGAGVGVGDRRGDEVVSPPATL